MSRASRRAVLRELRRGPAAVLVVAMLALALPDLLPREDWAARWPTLAVDLRSVLLLLLPVVAAAAAWRAQREARTGVDTLLASVPRPSWQQVLVTWGTVTAASCAGVLLVWGVCAAFVLRVPGAYTGGGWGWTLLVAAASLAAAAAAGVALGRLTTARLLAPLTAVAVFFLVAVPTNAGGGVSWLSPVMDGRDWFSDTVTPATQLLQLALFGGLALALFGVAGLERRRWAAVPAAVALVAGVVLAGGGDRWVDDPVALAPVCTQDAPVVCVHRINAFALAQVAEQVRPVLRAVEGIPGAPTRAEPSPLDGPAGADPPGGAAVSMVELNLLVDRSGRLVAPEEVRSSAAYAVTGPDACLTGGGDDVFYASGPDGRWIGASFVARALVGGTARLDDGSTPEAAAFFARLQPTLDRLRDGGPQANRAWLEGYYAARSSCDLAALGRGTGL